MSRDNFSYAVKIKLAQRAGYLCSICNIITVGSSNEGNDKINLTGVAAHISAASPGGRRYDKNITPVQRTSIENGIWLCTSHSDLVDGDEVTFTTSLLKFIKKNHEQKIKLKQSGINVDKGIITKMELSNFARITNPVSLDFTERNIICGNNGVGKTLILELIASLVNKEYLKRWVNEKRKPVNSFCKISYFKNQADNFSISIDQTNKVSYFFNDNPIPVLVPPIHILFIRQSYWDFLLTLSLEEKRKSLVYLMSKYFSLTEDEFIGVVGTMMLEKKFYFNDFKFNETKSDFKVKFDSMRDSPFLSFNSLSGGEKDSVIIEIALKIASYYSKFNSTILLIEYTSFNNIDYEGVNYLFDIIRLEKPNYQFFFTTMENINYNLKDFNINELIKTETNEVIVQKKLT